jgi:type IV pilus assembly protein PilV
MALIMLSDITDRILANKATRSCFVFTTNTTTGKPFLGVGTTGDGHAVLSPCSANTSAYNAQADAALAELDDLLEGGAETAGGSNVGGVIGARACVSYDTTTELTGQPGTGLFTVVVSWQGMADLMVPAANCANDQYGTAAKRRAVSQTFRVADLL